MSKATSKDPIRAMMKEEAAALRAEAREARKAQRQSFRDWLQERRIRAQKRHAEKAKAPRGPRGVDRVPARYRVHRPASTALVTPELGTSTLPDGRRVRGNYADRRRAGARGHARRPRPRELAGARARREARFQATVDQQGWR